MKGRIIYSAHVVSQMFKRNITEKQIEDILKNGIIIKEYCDDKPYPSFLILGYIESMPLHVVYAVNDFGQNIIIIAYKPDHNLWSSDFTIKKK